MTADHRTAPNGITLAPVGDDTNWKNWLGHWESFDCEPDLYARSQAINAVTQDGKVIGSLVWDPHGIIRHVYVSPDHAGQGVMRLMLTAYDGPAHVDGDFCDHDLRRKITSILHEH